MDQVAQTQLCSWANQMDRPTVGDNVIYYTRVSPAVACEAWAEQMQIDWPTVGDGEGYTPVLRRPWWPLLQCRPCVNIRVVLSCYCRLRIGLVPASSEVDSVVMFMTLIGIYIYIRCDNILLVRRSNINARCKRLACKWISRMFTRHLLPFLLVLPRLWFIHRNRHGANKTNPSI